jgi:hypothetical protein
MRRRRLQHAADILCQMFCGWRLVNSYERLPGLGSGTLAIDALTGSCSFEGVPIEPLNIAGELQAWLSDDLSASRIPPESLTRAVLTARLTYSTTPRSGRVTKVYFFRSDGTTTRSTAYHRLLIECESEVATDEAVYRSRYRDIEEWPEGWP